MDVPLADEVQAQLAVFEVRLATLFAWFEPKSRLQQPCTT